MKVHKLKRLVRISAIISIVFLMAIMFASCKTDVSSLSTNPIDTGQLQTEPAPTEPAPTEPVPTEPVPTEPTPTEPVPTEPVPTEPTPTEPECQHEYLNDCDTTCEKCGEVRNVTHAETTVTGKAATCTEDGYTDSKVCSLCGIILEASTVIPATGHTSISIPDVPATCTTDGSKGGTKCSVCDEIIKSPAVVNRWGHKFSEQYSADEAYHWRGCTNTGCTRKIAEGKHSFTVSSVCDTCKYTAVTIDATKYPGGYRHSYDFLNIDGVTVAGYGMSVKVDDFTRAEIYAGQIVSLIGWAGFPTQKISQFGYYFDGNVNDIVIDSDFKRNPEQAVVDAGGEFRFTIDAETALLAEGTHTVTFVAVLENGTYAVMKNVELYIPESYVPVDENIEKAEKEEIGDVDMTMSATSNANEYTTPAGLTFTASGQGMVFSGGRFTITSGSGVKINFNDYEQRFPSDFNRYKIAYYSSAPLKVTVTYNENGSFVTDVVYLEAGDDMLFNCLTLGYMSGVYSKYIMSLDIKILGSSSTATFALHDVKTEVADIIGNGGVNYIRNDRYRLGIKLAWGGGISYFRDFEDGNSKIFNLINNADTGRLIQQSYYGTNDKSEYTPGSYGENVWPYNPVQGGNLYNQHSRIIDFVIKDYSVYIKAQPRDWAKEELTPSYMENVYTLYSDRVQVDNRFVDFSNFKNNPVRDQELPAFYTIGYLNTFKYYNGTKPWQNDTLTVKPDLDFWGGNPNAYFTLKSGNTETWCAWVNNATDYGIGIYVPNIDRLLAGRHAYNAYPDAIEPESTACSYVAPLNRFKIVSFEALEYSYLITSGSTNEIRNLFNAYKDFATNADLTSPVFGYKSTRN